MKYTCRQVVEVLFEYVEGQLADEMRQHVQVHLEACPPCVAYIQSYHLTVTMSRKLEPKPVPDTLRERFIKAASELPPEGPAHGASR